MQAATNDIDILQFAEMMCFLEPHPKLTEELDRWKNPYSSEKAHMCLWFGGQTTTGSGSYTRNKPNHSTKIAYNRLLCPGGMLWIAEVLGETPDRLKEAAKSARKAEKMYWRNRGDGFRKVIPFQRIYELYRHPENWKYDKRLIPAIGRDSKGYPVGNNEDEILRVISTELT